MKLESNILKTLVCLDDDFVNEDNNGNMEIDKEYLEDMVYLQILNTEALHRALYANRRVSVHSLVWAGLLGYADNSLNSIGYKATGYHLKMWFRSHNIDPKEFFSNLCQVLAEEREEELARKGKKVVM